ncbi:MAG: head GIN domain-containing protein [Pseudomonadales bacterium]
MSALVSVAALTLALGWGQPAAAEVREVADFERISFSLPATLVLETGDRHQVAIEAAADDLGRIVSESRNGELQLRWQTRGGSDRRSRPSAPVVVTVTAPQLSSLRVTGSGGVSGGSWSGKRFEVVATGSGTVHFASLEVGELRVRLSGSGGLEVESLQADNAGVDVMGSGGVVLRGVAPRQTLKLTGSGRVDAGELAGTEVSVRTLGSGTAIVWAEGALAVEIMGSGDVSFRGSPEITSRSHGSGKLLSL